MSIKSILAAGLFALAATAQADPHALTPQALGPSYYSTGLSTQEGSSQVTRTEAGAFRDEFLIHFDGLALVNAWLDTSADLADWANQGISFTRAGFVGIDGSELSFDILEIGGTRFSFGANAPFEAHGDFLFFVEGVAGDPGLAQTAAQAAFNSFSYSGGINLEALADPATDLPEPASMALAGLALASALIASRRRRAD